MFEGAPQGKIPSKFGIGDDAQTATVANTQHIRIIGRAAFAVVTSVRLSVCLSHS